MKLQKDYYYFYCCAGLGDTMITVGWKEEIEKKIKGQVIFIVKETHQFILDMYREEAYLILKKGEIPPEEKIRKYPQKGYIYAAHPCLHPELSEFFAPVRLQTSTIRFVPWFRKFYRLEAKVPLKLPLQYPTFSEKLKEKCNKIAPIEQIVLFSPEATSMIGMKDWFWEDLVKEVKELGYVAVSNVIAPENAIKGTKYIPLTSKEAVVLGLNCKAVYSVRSGFCDLLFSKGKELHVYYPTHSSYYLYSLNHMFHRNDIDEQIILERD